MVYATAIEQFGVDRNNLVTWRLSDEGRALRNEVSESVSGATRGIAAWSGGPLLEALFYKVARSSHVARPAQGSTFYGEFEALARPKCDS